MVFQNSGTRGAIKIPVLAASGYRVIALDQRGYNVSDKPKGVRHYRLETLLDDALGA